MIEHVVLFKLRPEVDSEKVDWMLRETRIRLNKIPVVRGLRCGYRIDDTMEWPFFLLVELESVEKLDAYMTDSVHIQYVAEVIKPHISERLALDFQSDLGPNVLLS
jgi:hypothetical protein